MASDNSATVSRRPKGPPPASARWVEIRRAFESALEGFDFPAQSAGVPVGKGRVALCRVYPECGTDLSNLFKKQMKSGACRPAGARPAGQRKSVEEGGVSWRIPAAVRRQFVNVDRSLLGGVLVCQGFIYLPDRWGAPRLRPKRQHALPSTSSDVESGGEFEEESP